VVCDRAEAAWVSERLETSLWQRERNVLRARADGLSTRQAAERLNISGKSAEAASTRARAWMRSLGS
jgi:RNA polymerase sigma-70 factor (ECF subfamily)